MDVKEIVARIEQGDFSFIEKAVNSPTETRHKVIANVSDAVSIAIASRDLLIENYKRQLQNLLFNEDEGFPEFSSSVISSIVDLRSALLASYFYNVNWFNSLTFSLEKKISMANQLIEKVSEFNVSYCPKLWSNIANVDPNIVALITYSNVKSSVSSDADVEEI